MSDNRRIKPGITISKEVWEKFKVAYPENTSRKMEELMRKTLTLEESIKYYSTSDDTKFTFENADSWNVSWENSSMVISNYSSDSSSISKEVVINVNKWDKS